jgi:hypothetical protein
MRVDYDEMHRAGADIVRRVRARRGMVLGAMFVAMIMLVNATQTGISSTKR